MKQTNLVKATELESLKLSKSLRILEAIYDLLPRNLVFVPEAGTMFAMGFVLKRVYHLGEEVSQDSDGIEPMLSRPAIDVLKELQSMNSRLVGEVQA